MRATELESELQSQGYETDGVIVWDQKGEYYAVGFTKSDLPTVSGYSPVTDPAILASEW